MGLTTAMFSGLSGMNANQTRIDTIGNNIANVNTTGFKASRTLFQSQLSYLISAGTSPNSDIGGTNPIQVGLGTTVGNTQRLFSPGSVETTGIASDMAIEGEGFFIVNRPSGQVAYTRDGSFSVDSANRLVTSNGDSVRGFGIDSSFNVIPGVLTDLTIPVGTMTVARPTSTIKMDGDLSADGTVATRGSITASQALVDGGGGSATANTALSDLRSATNPTQPMFAAGETITVRGLQKGPRDLPTATFVVGTDGNTLGDFATWLQGTLGIDTSAGLPGKPGVSVENGQLIIGSNAGVDNAITISANDISSTNAGSPLPFTFSETQAANGASIFTAVTAYDSLGTPVNLDVTFTLDSTPATGPVWRYYVESTDNAGGPRLLGNGTVAFDTAGNFLNAANNTVQLSRAGTGAASPLGLTFDFAAINGLSTRASNVVMSEQDGYPPGTLLDYSVGVDGVINGSFSNGLSRPLGQVALAMFPNQEGLLADADNLFLVGPNSGNPIVTTAGLSGAGRVLGGSLELSNVDLSREFIGLITSSTAFQASSRVISTSSDLLDQLMLIVR